MGTLALTWQPVDHMSQVIALSLSLHLQEEDDNSNLHLKEFMRLNQEATWEELTKARWKGSTEVHCTLEPEWSLESFYPGSSLANEGTISLGRLNTAQIEASLAFTRTSPTEEGRKAV